jgi:hypothetical protein
MRGSLALLAPLLLAGCTVVTGPLPGVPPGGDGAVYRHPTSGEFSHCADRRVRGFVIGGIPGAIGATSALEDCQEAMEAAGYIRQGWGTRWDAAGERVGSPMRQAFCRENGGRNGIPPYEECVKL